MKLICFPNAGGDLSLFRRWRSTFLPEISVEGVELPDNDLPLVQACDEMASATPVSSRNDGPFAVFGHSFGGLAAFEFTRALEARGLQMPVALFISACAPFTSVPSIFENLSECKDADLPENLIERLVQQGGIPKIMASDSYLMQRMVKRLRRDMARLNHYSTGLKRVACPLIAIGGTADPLVPVETLGKWKEHTDSLFFQEIFTGGHFYFREQLPSLAIYLKRILLIQGGIATAATP